MPWLPNQEHLVNHYSTAHGIMKPADTLESELDNIPFSNADLEASLSSMTDLRDDGGDFESLLDALPPSPESRDNWRTENKGKGIKSICPLRKEDMKVPRTHHFATAHFR